MTDRDERGVGRVAVIGAGMAGLACARALVARGVEVVVFDKGRRVGGRMSTRRQDGRQLDHGAQYFTAKGDAFRAAVDGWLADGAVARWRFRQRDEAGVEERERFVGHGENRALPEHLARGLDVRLETRVAPLDGEEPGALAADDGAALGRFDRVVVTAPLAQARALLAAHPPLAARLADARHAPCWALMADFAAPLAVEAEALRGDGPIAWAAREASKPGRPASEAWVAHASAAWSEAHLEDAPEDVAARLLDAFASLAGPLPEAAFRVAHRWRYAKVEAAVGVPCVHDAARGVVVAGDGLLGPRIEAAWQSGVAAAEALVGA